MSSFEVTQAVRALKTNPHDELARQRLSQALACMSQAQFAAVFPFNMQPLASMVWRAGRHIVDEWERTQARWQWIRTASDLVKILEKPKPLPAQKRARRKAANDPIDLKKKAAGDD